MPNNSLSALIPIHLDGLYLSSETEVAAPMVDFTRLNDHSKPYLGENLTAKPLSTSTLEAGVHLHWALPDALTKTMSLPLVQKQAFLNVFGTDTGDSIWQKLVTAGWLVPSNPKTPTTAKSVKTRKDRLAAPANIDAGQLATINSLLDHPGFPPVPNRWLVSRYAADGKAIEKTWMVESDYVWPANAAGVDSQHYTSYPVQAPAGSTGALKYCFLGRSYDAATPPPTAPADSYLPSPLTAVGYGEPSFAAFYPNCRSVFGFCDTESKSLSTACTYSILGFYSDSSLDYYALFRQDFLSHNPTPYPNIQLLGALKEEFQWFFPITVSQSDFSADHWKLMSANGWLSLDTPTATSGALSAAPLQLGNTLGAGNEDAEKVIRTKLDALIDQQLPGQTLFYASTVVDPKAASSLPDENKVSLAIGNTGTEAMSAFLADKISQQNKVLVEEYLEARQLATGLEYQQQDLGAKFQEARHEKGFKAVPGGTIWVVRPQQANIEKADVKKAMDEVTLPDDLADILNELNSFQQQFDQANFKIESLQQEIFADWCHYLAKKTDWATKHSAKPEHKRPTDKYALKKSTDKYALKKSTDKYAKGGPSESPEALKADLDNMRKFIEWQSGPALKSLKDEAMNCSKELTQKHQQLTASLSALPQKQPLILQSVAAPRYWQPNDPAILITGVQPSPRHGQDGRLREDNLLACRVSNTTMALSDISQGDKKIVQIKSEVPQDFGLNSADGHWHPLIMDWAVSFTQAPNKFSGNPDEYQYDSAYLEDNYSLDAVGFSKANKPPTGASIPFSGRCILAPSANLLQKLAVIKRLAPEILARIKTSSQKPMLSIGDFQSWLTTIKPGDSVLAGLASKKAAPTISDEQFITDCISTRLLKTSDGQLPGIAAWYWQEATKAIQATDKSVPDPNGSPDQLVAWANERTKIKSTYYGPPRNIEEAKQSDFFLQNDPNFVPWLKTEAGDDALAAFFKEVNISPTTDKGQYLTENFNQFINWYQPQVRNILHTVLDYLSYQHLCSVEGLSQSLGVLNQALISRSQSFQLNIADPEATDADSKSFAEQVRNAVQGQNIYSPMDGMPFSPIRAGIMSIDRVNLINTFGQYWPPVTENLSQKASLVCAEPMASGKEKEVALQPRLAQPARLNFRWLSANASAGGQDLVEMNSHPATSPICGWLLPNNLDNSLMVYQQDGQALGYIDQKGAWAIYPGVAGPASPDKIANPQLQKMVQRICSAASLQADYISDFIQVLDTALDNIQPDNSAQHDALALLMGRPIALVRAAISLEHKGGDPANQSSRIFLEDLGRFNDALKKNPNLAASDFQRNTFQVDGVKIPLRLGEYRQLNDGLVGYWIDNGPSDALPKGAVTDTFYAPQSFDPHKNPEKTIMTYDEHGEAFQFNLSLGQPDPLEISMLLDPRGKVHATCGILPVKNISLPPDQYQQALSRIEIAFLSTPILSLPRRLHLSLPNEPGYGWAWVEKDGNAWKTIGTVGSIRRADVEGLVSQPSDAGPLWQELIDQGWIKATGADTADVVQLDMRTAAALSKAFEPLQPAIEDMLERSHISPFDATAAFSGAPEIREGWLKLSKTT